MRRRVLPALALIAALLAGVLPAGAQPAAPAALPDLDVVDPVRFDYGDAIVEHRQVPSRNGVDLIWIDIIRPRTAEPVPAIMMVSPYFNTLGRGWRGELKTPHQGPSNPGLAVTRLLGAGTRETRFPGVVRRVLRPARVRLRRDGPARDA